MSGVRSLTGSDIDQVAELHNRGFLQSRPMTPQLRQRYRQWLETVFLNNQARLPGYDPLVYEHEGSVVGFIGVAGRRFTLLGQTYTGTLHSNFVVHPAHRGRGVGGALFRAYLELPRDFAFVDEVGERNRPLHERLGMTVSMAQSVRWILPCFTCHRPDAKGSAPGVSAACRRHGCHASPRPAKSIQVRCAGSAGHTHVRCRTCITDCRFPG